MSWLPIFNSWVLFVAVVSVFLWNVNGMMLFVVMLLISAVFMIREVLSMELRYAYAFWLFILSEIMVFVTLFTTAMWNDDGEINSISDWMELPFLGCFLLLGSSISATAYHHGAGLKNTIWLLYLTLALGAGFTLLQICEFYDCECDILYNVFHAACFCTVGLHFIHVLLGVLALSIMLSMGVDSLESYYIDLIVWYWHFVDYIWLFVFLIIYVI